MRDWGRVKFKFNSKEFFPGAIFLEIVIVPFLKVVINLPWTI